MQIQATTNKTNLTRLQARLVGIMQRMNFGRIEDLHVLDGEPLFDPPPRIVRSVKLGRENGPRPEAGHPDFALKAEVIELIAHLEAVGDGVIERIEVQHGLPALTTFEDATA